MFRRPSAIFRSFLWNMPSMPSHIVRRYWSSASTKALGSNLRAGLLRVAHARDDELRVGLDHVVLLLERLLRQLPVHREPAGVPPLGAQRLDLPPVEDRGGRLEALAQRRRLRIEVDPRAAAPHLAPHRREVDVPALELTLSERLPHGDSGVGAFGAVAPAVERAGEPGIAVASVDGHPHTTVAARVVEGLHAAIGLPNDDDGLIEDLVLHPVVDVRDLLEPTGHLPGARPEVLRLELEELRVVVALLARSVGPFDGERNGAQCRHSLATTNCRPPCRCRRFMGLSLLPWHRGPPRAHHQPVFRPPFTPMTCPVT